MTTLSGFAKALVAAGIASTVAIAGAASAAGNTPGSAATTQGTGGAATAPSAPDAKIAAPSKAEAPDVAFKKLDLGGKGYVTMEDAKPLSGFDTKFQANDVNHDGRLSSDEFRKAWAEYSGKR